MIRNAVIHISNEQPLLVDLYTMPTSADVSLVCTNVRMLDGKKPIFVDHSNSVFVFAYATIRFLEIMAGSTDGVPSGPDNGVVPVAEPPSTDDPDDGDLELDEDFLRRIREV